MVDMDIFTALAEPTRRNIVEMLARDGELSSSDISSHFDISAPAISQHLKVLREADIVRVEKKAQQRIYQLNKNKIKEIEEWARKMLELWNERFDALDEFLKTEKEKLIKHT